MRLFNVTPGRRRALRARRRPGVTYDTGVLSASVQRRRFTLLEGRLALQMYLHLCVKTLAQHKYSVYEAFGVWFFLIFFPYFYFFVELC